MKVETLNRIEAETLRFLERLQDVRKIEQENTNRIVEANMKPNGHAYILRGTRKHGALRRSAHDLKEILTFITQNKDIQ